MRVFLDANVLVAAFATRGLCADVIRYILADYHLITGEVVLKELRRVLTRRVNLPRSTIDDLIDWLRGQEIAPLPKKPAAVPVRDPDDAWILASAIAGRADVLVTGDRDLLDIADSAPLPILSPRGFWEFVRQKG